MEHMVKNRRNTPKTGLAPGTRTADEDLGTHSDPY